MGNSKGNTQTLQEFITDRIIDTHVNKSGIVFAARESSKKLVNIPKLLQTKKISRKFI